MAYRTPARWLAPLALLGAGAAILLTVSSTHSSSSSADSGISSSTSTTGGSATKTTSTTSTGKGSTPGKLAPRYYIVKPGDVLSAIAAAANVPLATIEHLNPGVDAQSLHAGQKIKLVP